MARKQPRNSLFSIIAAFVFLFEYPVAAQIPTAPPDTGSSLQIGEPQVPSPTDVNCTRDQNFIIIKWNNVVSNSVVEFHIFRYDDSHAENTLKMIKVVPRTTAATAIINYKDYAVEPLKVYKYFITSKDRFGVQSGNSNTCYAITPSKM